MTSDPPPETTASTWADLAVELAGAIVALDDGSSLTVDVPERARPTAPRGGPLGRILGGRHVMVAPWVQFTRVEDLLRGSCVRGSERHDGFPMSAADQQAVVDLGWHVPRVEESSDFIRWWPDDVPQAPYIPGDLALVAAQAGLAVLAEVFGAEVRQIRTR